MSSREVKNHIFKKSTHFLTVLDQNALRLVLFKIILLCCICLFFEFTEKINKIEILELIMISFQTRKCLQKSLVMMQRSNQTIVMNCSRLRARIHCSKVGVKCC